jgi:GNAT superfamily N-acetyltransferase
MVASGGLMVREIKDAKDINFDLPDGLSFFNPHIHYYIKEALEIGGKAYLARTAEGAVSGIFTYDALEKMGAVYTRSKEVFDHFFEHLQPGFLFSEMESTHENEIYDIYSIDLQKEAIDHSFDYDISVANGKQSDELEQFMITTHPGMNRRWVKVALSNNDRCLVVRLNDEIAGLGWLSLVNGVGRLHSLFVRPQFRGMGIGEDILYARLLWLKSNRARLAFSEISRSNHSSSKVAQKGHMRVSGQIFLYLKDDPKNR